MVTKQEALDFHLKNKGKIEIKSKVQLKNMDDLALSYTPGVANASIQIIQDTETVDKYTNRKNTVAIVTDGSAVLGLGDIGPKPALPVMEGKSVLFKKFANIDAIPILLDTNDIEEIVKTIKNIAPTFGGINLEDISAPRCFEIEERLIEELDIPVFHDDQHGTAIVVLAGLINSLICVQKSIEEVKIVINGAGAAGIAICKLLMTAGAINVTVIDSKGAIYEGRSELNKYKEEISKITNQEMIRGGLIDAIKGCDVFIGVSVPGSLTVEMVKSMNSNPIVFALANPIPEISYDEAKQGGAMIYATGRSDFPNQINNVLAFPGIFRGVLDAGIVKITDQMKVNAAAAIASLVGIPAFNKIIPGPFTKGIVEKVSEAVRGTR